MSTNIIDQLPEDIRKELFVDIDGRTYASLRAIARLANVSPSALVDQRPDSKGKPRGILWQIKCSLESIKNNLTRSNLLPVRVVSDRHE